MVYFSVDRMVDCQAGEMVVELVVLMDIVREMKRGVLMVVLLILLMGYQWV